MWIKTPLNNWIDTDKILAVIVHWPYERAVVSAVTAGGKIELARFTNEDAAQVFADNFVAKYLKRDFD